MSAVRGFRVCGIVPTTVSITETNTQTVRLLWPHNIVGEAQNMHFSFHSEVTRIMHIHSEGSPDQLVRLSQQRVEGLPRALPLRGHRGHGERGHTLWTGRAAGG